MKPLFRREYNEYTRDFDFVKLWAQQCTTYAKIQDNTINEDEYREWLYKEIKKDGAFPLFNPRMKVNMKNENNDRYKTVITMMDYLSMVTKGDLRIAPTFTTYLPESKHLSLESAFLENGMRERSKEKKLKFQAKERGDDVAVEYHDNMQLMLKIQNNSSSGAKATQGTILYNQTGHSTLTSICRSETSFANSVNERFLGGYKHYFSVETVVNNILAVLTFCDINQTEQVMQRHGLHYVQPAELLRLIKRSTDLYWHSPKHFQQIEEFVNKLTPLQCSMYLYNSDLYSLREYNEPFIRKLYDDIIHVDHLEPIQDEEEINHWISIMDSDLAAFIVVLASKYCNGKSIFTAMSEAPEIKPIVAAIVRNTIERLERIRDLIECFWVTDVQPFETARVPEMMRGVVLGSDTDSSLFAVDTFWIAWYKGRVMHDEEATNVEALTVYLTTQYVTHVLGAMTGVINILPEKRGIIAMKNEFMFSSFTTTSAGKHYFSKKDAQEGIMIAKNKLETEIKGVRLKHTKVPESITKLFHEELFSIMRTIDADQQISLLELVRSIAKLEWDVYQDILKGNTTYLQRAKVKVNEAYTNDNNAYKRGYLMWEAVFADKYGHTMEPPYDGVSLKITPDTKNKYALWLEAIEDKNIAEKLNRFIEEELEGRPLTTFILPQAVINTVGIPEELKMVIQPRELVFKIVSPWYLLLESFGYFLQNKHLTRLCSDNFPEWNIPYSLFGSSEE